MNSKLKLPIGEDVRPVELAIELSATDEEFYAWLTQFYGKGNEPLWLKELFETLQDVNLYGIKITPAKSV